MATKVDKQALWIDWTHDVIGQYVAPDDVEGPDELADDMVDVATKYADSMLDAFERRFEPSEARVGRRRKKKPEAEDDDDD